MSFTRNTSRALRAAAIALSLSCAAVAWAVDADEAKIVARLNGCFKCHSVEHPKDGPAYREVAAKYRNQADAPAKLYDHVTLGRKVKFPDGHEENHKIIGTDSPAEITNLIGWILSL